MKKILSIFQTQYPPFDQLNLQMIPKGLFNQFKTNLYLAPRYQKIKYGEDLLKCIRYYQRSNIVDYSVLKGLVENIVLDYQTVMKLDRPHQNVVVSKDEKIPANHRCPYHGTATWIYSAGCLNPTPILFFQRLMNPAAGIAAALSNLYYRLAFKEQVQKQFKKYEKKYDHLNTYYGENDCHGYSIMTTGNMWQLIRIDANYLLEKSIILESRNEYRSIIHDEKLIEVVFGMLDYCLDLPTENTKVLQKAYQYINQRRWMNEAQSESELDGPIISKLLLSHYKKKL